MFCTSGGFPKVKGEEGLCLSLTPLASDFLKKRGKAISPSPFSVRVAPEDNGIFREERGGAHVR